MSPFTPPRQHRPLLSPVYPVCPHSAARNRQVVKKQTEQNVTFSLQHISFKIMKKIGIKYAAYMYLFHSGGATLAFHLRFPATSG